MSDPGDPRREDGPTKAGPVSGRARNVGLALMAVAVLLWLLALGALFLPLPGGQKLWTASALGVGGEVFFWISAAVLGRELFRRYRSHLDPRRIFGRKGP